MPPIRCVALWLIDITTRSIYINLLDVICILSIKIFVRVDFDRDSVYHSAHMSIDTLVVLHRSTLLHIFIGVLIVDLDGFRVHIDRVDPYVDCTRALLYRPLNADK